MIDLNNKDTKDYFGKLIITEINNINISLNEQKYFNFLILDFVGNISNKTSSDVNAKTLPDTQSDLVTVSQLLTKISFNLSSYAKLLNELENIKNNASLQIINDIEQYNKMSASIIKRIEANTSKIEEFVLQKHSISNLKIRNNINNVVPPSTVNTVIEEVKEVETPVVDTVTVPVEEPVEKDIQQLANSSVTIDSLPSMETIIQQIANNKEIPTIENIEVVEETPTIENVIEQISDYSSGETSNTSSIAEELPSKPLVKTIVEDIPVAVEPENVETKIEDVELLFDIPALLAKASANIPTLDFSDDSTVEEEPVITKTAEPNEEVTTKTPSNIIAEALKRKAIIQEDIETPAPELEKVQPIVEPTKEDEVNIKQINTTEVNIEPPTIELAENTLVISELEGKVVLPYTMTELKHLIEENPSRYESLEDIVETVFTRPLKYYRNAPVARFKEAYKLIRKKEFGSIGEALDLGMELLSNYNLHPAVISACKNLNELDIYLSCLEYNELDDFKFFKVLFNVTPSTKIHKKQKGKRVA